MIRDIIVNLTPAQMPADTFDPACAYAISLAEAYNANITGIAFAYDPPGNNPESSAGYVRLPDFRKSA